MRATCGWLAAAVLALLACVPARASAQLRFGVRPFEGPASASVHKAVVRACESTGRVEVVDNARLEGAAAALHVDLDSDAGRAAVARELDIAVFMDGRVQRRGQQLVFVLETYRGRSGEKVGEGSVRARRVPRLAILARERLASTLRRLKNVPEQAAEAETDAETATTETETDAEAVVEADPEPTPESQPEPDVGRDADPDPEHALGDAPDEAEPEAATLTALELGASVAAITRHFSYRDARAGLAEHGISFAPMARLRLNWYPGAHFGEEGVGGNLGLYAQGDLMLSVSTHEGSLTYETEHRELAAGMRFRVPIERSELGLHAGVGASDVRISDSQFGGDPEVPSVAYRYARVGADARIAVGSALQLGLGVAYLHPFAFGELTDEQWFPHTRGAGVDAEASLGYALSRELSMQVALGMTRYFMSLHPDPSDRGVVVMRRIAGGAADQQLHLGIGAALRF